MLPVMQTDSAGRADISVKASENKCCQQDHARNKLDTNLNHMENQRLSVFGWIVLIFVEEIFAGYP